MAKERNDNNRGIERIHGLRSLIELEMENIQMPPGLKRVMGY